MWIRVMNEQRKRESKTADDPHSWANRETDEWWQKMDRERRVMRGF
jgi:hypothetical protein